MRPAKYNELDRPYRTVYVQVPPALHRRFHSAATKEGKRSLKDWVIEKLTLATKGHDFSDTSPSASLEPDSPTT